MPRLMPFNPMTRFMRMTPEVTGPMEMESSAQNGSTWQYRDQQDQAKKEKRTPMGRREQRRFNCP